MSSKNILTLIWSAFYITNNMCRSFTVIAMNSLQLICKLFFDWKKNYPREVERNRIASRESVRTNLFELYSMLEFNSERSGACADHHWLSWILIHYSRTKQRLSLFFLGSFALHLIHKMFSYLITVSQAMKMLIWDFHTYLIGQHLQINNIAISC